MANYLIFSRHLPFSWRFVIEVTVHFVSVVRRNEQICCDGLESFQTNRMYVFLVVRIQQLAPMSSFRLEKESVERGLKRGCDRLVRSSDDSDSEGVFVAFSSVRDFVENWSVVIQRRVVGRNSEKGRESI